MDAMQTWEKAYKDYKYGMKYIDLAEKYNVSINTVKSWKVKHKWEREKPKRGKKKTTTTEKIDNEKIEKNADPQEKHLNGRQKEHDETKYMSLRQRKFADAYLSCGVVEKAALEAGYSATFSRARGYEVLNYPVVKAYLKEKQAEMSSPKIATAKEIMEYYTSVMRGEIKDGEKPTPISERTKAAAELAKRIVDIQTEDEKELSKLDEVLKEIKGVI